MMRDGKMMEGGSWAYEVMRKNEHYVNVCMYVWACNE
jgi:hypothetical protein